ncbi:MAG: DUF707 domain-containing protein [Pseudomonadales bacterium]
MGNSVDISIQRVLPQPKSRFLVFIRAGDSVEFDYWSESKRRNWDVAISSYGEEELSRQLYAEADYLFMGGLSKMQSFKRFYEAAPQIKAYDAILMLDNDIDIDPDDLANFFELHCEHGFSISQPALSHDSNSNFDLTLRYPMTIYRKTTYVEVMAPCFSQEAINKTIQTFDETISGWGMDLVWPLLVPDKSIGVIDLCVMRHTAPMDAVNGPFYQYLKSIGVHPIIELEGICKKYNIDRFSYPLGNLVVNSQTLHVRFGRPKPKS